jgi:hypothetical protein
MKLLDQSMQLSDGSNGLILTTDSAIQRDGKPLFPPEISENWELALTIAYRIARLGKSIAARFAPRYYDAYTIAARLIPLDLVDNISQPLSPLATAFDGAMAMGRWIEIEPQAEVAVSQPLQLSSSTFNPEAINTAIDNLSRSFILKTGDVIIPSAPIARFSVAIDTKIEASLNNQNVLSFRIK